MLSEHLSYVSDRQRAERYTRALAETICEGDRVLDLGCGIGVLGLLSLRAGAGHVTAIEKTGIAAIAEEVFDRAGQSERTTVIRATSTRIAPDKADFDLIVCDHVGYFALDYGILGLLRDARQRFLKPGGRLMPEAVTLFLAPVDADARNDEAFGWSAERISDDFGWLSDYSTNAKYPVSLTPEQIMAPPRPLGDIDFRTEEREFFSYKAEFETTRAGRITGLAGWFECRLSATVSMTNSPLASDRIRRHQAFFPIAEPIETAPGDVIRAGIAMRPDEHDFAWTLDHRRSGRRFRQASLKGEIWKRERLMRTRGEHVPTLTEAARAGQIVMGYCDGRRSVDEILEAVLSDHPRLFATKAAIRDFVLEWLGSNSR